MIVGSVELAKKALEPSEKLALVEGGLCNGWAAWFAMRAARRYEYQFEYWAYDS